MKYLGGLVVWVFLWAIGTVGMLIGVLRFPFDQSYAQRIFILHDRAAAAVLGRSGLNTLSHECRTWDCYFCKWTGPIVSWLLGQKDHYKEYDGE